MIRQKEKSIIDSQTWTRIKKAIRDMWNWSQEYKDIVNAACRCCQHCKKKVSRKSDLYIEHLQAIELHDYSTVEEYYLLMRDKSNLAVWCKDCREQKDKEDLNKIKEQRNKRKKKMRTSQRKKL